MATVRKEIAVAVAPDDAWDAIRDFGALHTRLVRGFVADTELEPALDAAMGHGAAALQATLEG